MVSLFHWYVNPSSLFLYSIIHLHSFIHSSHLFILLTVFDRLGNRLFHNETQSMIIGVKYVFIVYYNDMSGVHTQSIPIPITNKQTSKQTSTTSTTNKPIICMICIQSYIKERKHVITKITFFTRFCCECVE